MHNNILPLTVLDACKEFNIPQEIFIAILVSKGFSKEVLKPTSNFTEEMYKVLNTNLAISQLSNSYNASKSQNRIKFPPDWSEINKSKSIKEVKFSYQYALQITEICFKFIR
jgi:translation initiation factor IF-2